MTTLNRRSLLRAAAASAALGPFPPAIQRALAIPANNATGTINDVEHVIILMQENRSFDHYFGTMPGVRGFSDRFTIPWPRASRCGCSRAAPTPCSPSTSTPPRATPCAWAARTTGATSRPPGTAAAWPRGPRPRTPRSRWATCAVRPALSLGAGQRLHGLRRVPHVDPHRHLHQPHVPVERHQRRQRGRPGLRDQRQLGRPGPVVRRPELDHLPRAPAGGRRALEGLQPPGQQQQQQPAGGVRLVPRGRRAAARAGLARRGVLGGDGGAVAAVQGLRQHHARRRLPAGGGRRHRRGHAAAGQLDRRARPLQRAPEHVGAAAGRLVHPDAAGHAHRQPRGVEQDGADRQLRRERLLLRPRAAARAAVAQRRRHARGQVDRRRRQRVLHDAGASGRLEQAHARRQALRRRRRGCPCW
jgi:hypothetical protein